MNQFNEPSILTVNYGPGRDGRNNVGENEYNGAQGKQESVRERYISSVNTINNYSIKRLPGTIIDLPWKKPINKRNTTSSDASSIPCFVHAHLI